MPKKPVRNAFYFFMKEIEPDLRREGRALSGIADIVPIAHPRYKLLPDKERERFEKMAREYKAKMRGVEGDKYKMDNVGNIIAHRKDHFEEMEKMRMKHRRQLIEQWPAGNGVIKEVFYLMKFNTLCKTDDDIYLPCEMGIIELTLEDGIRKEMHSFIDPGPIPSGYRYKCVQTSEDTHKIPVENFDLGSSNYRDLWVKLEQFINPSGVDERFPPVYSKGRDQEETSHCLKWLYNNANVSIPMRLKRVFELEGLVIELYNHGGHKLSKSLASELITTSVFEYNRNISCNWHDEQDCKDCALGIPKRHAFHMLDGLASIYKYELTNKHLPERMDLSKVVTVIPGDRSTAPHPRKTWGMEAAAQPYPAANQRYGATSRHNDHMDDADDEGFHVVSLRRPNPVSGGVWNADTGRSAPPVARGSTTSSFMQDDVPANRYAGRAAPPEASFAPPPPAAWHSGDTARVVVQAPSIHPPTVGRGLITTPMDRGQPVNVCGNSATIPGGLQAPGAVANAWQRPASIVPASGRGIGRGGGTRTSQVGAGAAVNGHSFGVFGATPPPGLRIPQGRGFTSESLTASLTEQVQGLQLSGTAGMAS